MCEDEVGLQSLFHRFSLIFSRVSLPYHTLELLLIHSVRFR